MKVAGVLTAKTATYSLVNKTYLVKNWIFKSNNQAHFYNDFYQSSHSTAISDFLPYSKGSLLGTGIIYRLGRLLRSKLSQTEVLPMGMSF